MRIGLALLVGIVAVGLVVGGCASSGGSGGEAKPAPAAAAAPAPAPVSVPAAKLAGPFAPDAEGFFRNWLVVGPFPNPGGRPQGEADAVPKCKGFDEDFLKGEAAYVAEAGKAVALAGGKSLAWKAVKSDADLVDFLQLTGIDMGGGENIVAYAFCWVEVEQDVDAQVRVGSDDGYKLWIDGQLVKALHEHRGAEQDQETHKVKLAKGKHPLLIKVDTDWGQFAFYLRILGPDGKKIAGLKLWN
jgi:hypothetical protein